MIPSTDLTYTPNQIHVRYAGTAVVLPTAVMARIDTHWLRVLQDYPRLTRGEIFTIADVDRTASSYLATMQTTDYAHYKYCQVADLGDLAIRTIHSSGVLVTSDGYLVFGCMADWTGKGGTIQCIGGSLDRTDLVGSEFDLERSLRREASEEVGLSEFQEFKLYAIIETPAVRKTAVVYLLPVNMTLAEVLKHYAAFQFGLVAKGELPEFKHLSPVKRDLESIQEYIRAHKKHLDHYMERLLLLTAQNL